MEGKTITQLGFEGYFAEHTFSFKEDGKINVHYCCQTEDKVEMAVDVYVGNRIQTTELILLDHDLKLDELKRWLAVQASFSERVIECHTLPSWRTKRAN